MKNKTYSDLTKSQQTNITNRVLTYYFNNNDNTAVDISKKLEIDVRIVRTVLTMNVNKNQNLKLLKKRYVVMVMVLLFSLFTTAQLDYAFTSGGIDPKIAITGTDNQFTSHGAGLNYYGKLGLRFKDRTEISGNIEVYDAIGYRSIGLQYNYAAMQLGKFEGIIGGEISIISRLERTDGFNERWMEYLPSFGSNAEIRYHLNKRFAIGWIANYKTRPDLLPYSRWNEQSLGFYTRFSTYVQIYFKF